MSFAGVSVVADGKLLQPSTASAIYSGTDSSGSWWYHLLVVQGYSRTKNLLPNGERIKGCSFRAGGYQWALELYPNGDVMDAAGFMSIFFILDQDVARPVKVQRQFSLIDEVDKQQPAHIRARKARDFCAHNDGWGRSQFIKQEDLEKSEHLKDDCFTIRCDFIIAEAVSATFIEVGADVMFEVGHESFAAHRNILAARSTVFMAELFGPMKEGTTAGAIQIQDMEPNVFNALLGFIYTDLMPKMTTVFYQKKMTKVGGEAEAEGGADEVTWLQHLLIAADRFDLQRLKSMCEERLSEYIDLSSVTSILGLAAHHHCRGLKEACLEFLKVQSAAILAGVMATSDWQHISATDPSVLNELITKLASKA
ncbi:BTB/POZ and MATH domain-containing protein 3-like [Triticum aestivum]|uniref:BTB/POZ and MATH domain-containing protein 3-like n=1 Tax=Triticum aestivum TaxID=4565 RepID=UPI001D0057DB|nr:BTB/POZ and MATH domain-containing protein 3-like [Triticum aestivum]